MKALSFFKINLTCLLLIVLLLGCAQPVQQPPLPSNTPPRVNNFVFPPTVTRVNFDTMISSYSPRYGSVEFFDPDGNLHHATLDFKQGNILVSMTLDTPTTATQGVIEFRNFKSRSRHHIVPSRFRPGQVTVDVTVTDTAGAVSNRLARVFILE